MSSGAPPAAATPGRFHLRRVAPGCCAAAPTESNGASSGEGSCPAKRESRSAVQGNGAGRTLHHWPPKASNLVRMRGRRARFSRSPADDGQAGVCGAAQQHQQRVSTAPLAIPAELHAKAATLLKFVKTTRRSGDKMKGELPRVPSRCPTCPIAHQRGSFAAARSRPSAEPKLHFPLLKARRYSAAVLNVLDGDSAAKTRMY